MDKATVDRLIKEKFALLPPTLQRAARYAIDNPRAIALHSMRTVAGNAGLQSSAMHRLARHLGFDGYESLRNVYREWLSRSTGPFTDRATALQQRKGRDKMDTLISEMIAADSNNLHQMSNADTLAALRTAKNLLATSDHIYTAGLRSLFPAAFYFNYACSMFMRNTTLLSGTGGISFDELRHARPGDTLVIFSYEPYARDALSAARFAHEQGLHIVAITDSVISPVAPHAEALIVVENTTPSLFPSIVPVMSIAQTLVAMLVAGGGRNSLGKIRKSETQLRDLQIYVQPGKSLPSGKSHHRP